MKEHLPEEQLLALSRLLAVHTGFSLPPGKWKTLKKGLAEAAGEAGFSGARHYARGILDSPAPAELLDPLVGRLTIGETYFLRDKQVFQIFEEHILRGLIDNPRRPGQPLRFWSAGCATGEEPYSIAMIMDRQAHQLRGCGGAYILGTDVNQRFLDAAQKALYTRWSLRATPESIIRRYFIRHSDNCFELTSGIREKVAFLRLNLAAASYENRLQLSAPMDVIFCRNVLMYLDAENRRHVINRLVSLLEEDGWLITSPAEAGFVASRALTPVRFSRITLFRKGFPREKWLSPEKESPARRTPGTNQENPHPRVQNPDLPRPARRQSDNKHSSAPSFQQCWEAARADYHRGKYREAANRLELLIAEESGHNEGFLMRSRVTALLTRCYANLGELQNAESACQAAIAAEKLNPELYFLLATIHQAAGDRESAVRALKQALYLDPDFVMAHFHLGFLMRQKGRIEDSRRRFANVEALLQTRPPDEILPQSEGMSAGSVLETVQQMMQ